MTTQLDEQRFINTAHVLHKIRERLPEVYFSHFTETLQSVRIIVVVVSGARVNVRVNLDTLVSVIVERQKTKQKFSNLEALIECLEQQ